MLILSREDILSCLPISDAIDAMRKTFLALQAGEVLLPQRIVMDSEQHAGTTLVMPSRVESAGSEALAVKVVSLFDGNQSKGLRRLQASVLLFDHTTGVALALLEGATLTSLRTGAASGLGAAVLAREDSRVGALFGAGVQGVTQLQAICAARPLETVWVYDLSQQAAEAFVAENKGENVELRVAKTPQQALADADVIAAATVSHTPIFDDADLKPGAHISAVGSYQPHVREIPGATVARSLIVVDQREAALEETGDLIQSIDEGLITPESIHAEIGEILAGEATGRTSDTQITFFKSVGLAIQDAVTARRVYDKAKEKGLGTEC